MRTLELRTVSNGRPKFDDRWLVLLLASLSDCVVDASEVTESPSVWSSQRQMLDVLITVIDMEDLPTVG